MQRLILLVSIMLAALLAACSGDGGNGQSANVPADAIRIHIIYAPESDQYMPTIIADFNQAYAEGRNPITGEALADGEKAIFVTGEPGSSGTIMQSIVSELTGTPILQTKPTIFQPSVSHWLALANFLSRREVFDLAEAQATALAPVVMAIWESRLEAIRNTVGYEDIGWEELLDVLNSPNGWADYGIPGRRTVYYGHTDPFISSTALSTLIAEFYASARANGFTGRRLTLEQVNDPDVQAGVAKIEELIRHYSQRTTEFKQYIAQGPDYLDFVALEENDLIFINRGLADYQPPERLVALYPKEGTFWHEHPFGILNAAWVSDEQKEAARVFTQYVLKPDVQEYIMGFGFRPANPDVELGFPFTEQNGVTIEGPKTVLDVPDPEVIAAIQESWSFVKKRADILLVIDTSGSMAADNKLEQAKEAALAFLENVEPANRIGLVTFNQDVTVRVPLDSFETNESQMRSHILSLRADGETELYGAIIESVEMMEELEEENRIRAIVVLSDGEQNSDSGLSLRDATTAIETSYNDLNPIIVIPVAYGDPNPDLLRVLDRIAAASNTTRQSGDPSNIQKVLEIISSYF